MEKKKKKKRTSANVCRNRARQYVHQYASTGFESVCVIIVT